MGGDAIRNPEAHVLVNPQPSPTPAFAEKQHETSLLFPLPHLQTLFSVSFPELPAPDSLRLFSLCFQILLNLLFPPIRDAEERGVPLQPYLSVPFALRAPIPLPPNPSGGRSSRALNADRVFLPQVTSFPGAAGGDEGSGSRSGEESHLGRSQRLDHAGPSAGEELAALVSQAPRQPPAAAQYSAGLARSFLG